MVQYPWSMYKDLGVISSTENDKEFDTLPLSNQISILIIDSETYLPKSTVVLQLF